MQKLYKCDFCEKEYVDFDEALQCEITCKNEEECANLKYYIIKYTYPRLKHMKWYKEELSQKREYLLELMKRFLYNDERDFRIEDKENQEMWKLFGELLPFMDN